MNANATKGFAQEAIGRDAGFLERIVNLFSDVPFFSDLAYVIVRFFHLEKEAAEWVPKFTIVLMAFAVPLTGVLIRAIFHIWMVVTRIVTKGTGANARFATFMEVFRGYTIPSRFSTVTFSYTAGFALVLLFAILLGIRMNGLLFLAISLGAGTGILMLKGNYGKIRSRTQPYPLGMYGHMLKLYLTGGYRLSFIRGDTKEQRDSHTIILGPTGSGKTTKYFIPGILEDAGNNCSVIFVEAKASAQEDMFSLVAPSWAAAGKKVILYDPWGDNSVSFNPLLGLKASFEDPVTRDTVEEVVDAIYRTYEAEKGSPSGDAAYYADQEKSLLKGLITICLYMPEGQRNLAAVYEVVNGTLESVVKYIHSAMSPKLGGPGMAEAIRKNLSWFTDMENGRSDLKASTLRGLAGKLAVFSHPRVRDRVINDELDLDIIFKEPTLFCIKSPLKVPGASTISSIIVRLLISRVPDKLAYGGGKNFKVYFYLDELQSLCIPKFDQFTKTARSSGTGIIAAVQDRTDIAEIIRAKLGINSVDGLLANFKTQVLLPGLQHGTTKHFSDSFGKREFRARRTIRSTQSPIDFSYTNTREEKLLLTPDNIRYMPEDRGIVVDSNNRPFFVQTVPWYRSSRYRSMIKANAGRQVEIYKKNGIAVSYESPPAPTYNLTDVKKVMKEKAFEDLVRSEQGLNAPFAPTGQEYDRAETGGRPSSDIDTVVDAMTADHDRSNAPMHKELP